MKTVVAEDVVVNEKTCVVDDRITGIVNLNYESLSDEDDISVDSLTVALRNLEEKKKSLEEEINNLYKDEIGFDDMLDIVTKILDTSRVAIPSSVEEDDIADIDDCFEILKSTAAFVDKRLKRIKTKPKPNVRENKDEDEIRVKGPTFTEEVLDEFEYRSCIKLDRNKEDDLHSRELEKDTENNSKCIMQDKLDDETDLNELNSDEYCVPNELVGDKDSNSSSGGEETLSTKRVSYEDFVNNIDVKDSDSKDTLVGRDRFGPQKTRWSLRKVFKKKK